MKLHIKYSVKKGCLTFRAKALRQTEATKKYCVFHVGFLPFKLNNTTPTTVVIVVIINYQFSFFYEKDLSSKLGVYW